LNFTALSPADVPGDVCFITTVCQADPYDDFGGIASYLLGTLVQLQRCHAWGKAPVVHWAQSFHAPCGARGNCWEEVFEPVTPAEELRGRSGVCVRPWRYDLGAAGLRTRELAGRTELRRHLAPLLAAYVRPGRALRRRLEDFEARHLRGVHALGVHVRATDYQQEFNESLVPRQAWIEAARGRFERLPQPRRIFVASDNQAMVDALAEAFGGDVVLHTDAPRVQGGRDGEAADWLHCDDAGEAPGPRGRTCLARQWEGALADAWLLSKCEELVSWEGAVSKLAMLLNPELPVHPVLAPPRRPEGGRPARGPSLLQLRSAASRCLAGTCSEQMQAYGLQALEFLREGEDEDLLAGLAAEEEA